MPTYPGYTFAGYPGNVSEFAGPAPMNFGGAAQQASALQGGGLDLNNLMRARNYWALKQAEDLMNIQMTGQKEMAKFQTDLAERTAREQAHGAREEAGRNRTVGHYQPSNKAADLIRDAALFDRVQGVDFRPVQLSGHPMKNYILAGQLQGLNLGAPSDPWVDVYKQSASSAGAIVPEQLRQAGVDRRFGRG